MQTLTQAGHHTPKLSSMARTVFHDFYPARDAKMRRNGEKMRTVVGTLSQSATVASNAQSPLRAVILLNSPQNGRYEFAAYRALRERRDWLGAPPLFICADGAIDFLCEQASALSREPTELLEALWPHLLCGDMDSSTEGSRSVVAAVAFHVAKVGSLATDAEFLRTIAANSERGRTAPASSCTVQVADQDTTDFEKCVELFRIASMAKDDQQTTSAGESPRVVVLGALGGRIDHELSSINCLVRNSDLTLILHNAYNTMFVCAPGTTTHFVPNPEFEAMTCGVIPLGQHLHGCTTTGLKWNLTSPTRALLGTNFGFGGMLSTSNEILDPGVGATLCIPAASEAGCLDLPPPHVLFTIAMDK